MKISRFLLLILAIVLIMPIVAAQATVSITPYPLNIQAGQNISIAVAPGTEGVGNSINIEQNGQVISSLGAMCAESKCFSEKEFIFYVPSNWKGDYSVSYTEYIKEAGNVVAKPAKSDFTVYPYVNPTEAAVKSAMAVAAVTTTQYAKQTFIESFNWSETGTVCQTKITCEEISMGEQCAQWVDEHDLKNHANAPTEAERKCGSPCPNGYNFSGACAEQDKGLGGLVTSGFNLGTLIAEAFLLTVAIVGLVYLGALVFGGSALGALGSLGFGTLGATTFWGFVGSVALTVAATSTLVQWAGAPSLTESLACLPSQLSGHGTDCYQSSNFDFIKSISYKPYCGKQYSLAGTKANCEGGIYVQALYWNDLNDTDTTLSQGDTGCIEDIDSYVRNKIGVSNSYPYVQQSNRDRHRCNCEFDKIGGYADLYSPAVAAAGQTGAPAYPDEIIIPGETSGITTAYIFKSAPPCVMEGENTAAGYATFAKTAGVGFTLNVGRIPQPRTEDVKLCADGNMSKPVSNTIMGHIYNVSVYCRGLCGNQQRNFSYLRIIRLN